MEQTGILKKDYWGQAVKNCADIKMLAVAAVITALSIAVKAINIVIIPPQSLIISFACYFHALGAFIYGPILALFAGAISDTLGAVIFPQGTYFLPYIIPETLSCFIYALFLWNRKSITVSRALAARFTVNLICNIILNSIITKWYFAFFGIPVAYPLVNSLRIAKNLIMFPLEGILMAVIISASVIPLKRMGVIRQDIDGEKITQKSIITVFILFVISIGLVIGFYFLLPYLKLHQITFL
ncbi:MAG: folate family ECF transporter S component [Clostridia bacterium]|nr:folate family ECF transporter S component [Clostridia bacterium]